MVLKRKTLVFVAVQVVAISFWGSNRQVQQQQQQQQTPEANALLRSGEANANDSKLKVIYTVFAGRKNRLLLQEPYWKEMFDLGAIDEVHLWDFTARMSLDDLTSDRAHLLALEQKYDFLHLMHPSDINMSATYWFDKNYSLAWWNLKQMSEDVTDGQAILKYPNARGYTEYFQYYQSYYADAGRHDADDVVIIKGDDDIVWINSTMVRPFAQYFHNHPGIFLLSASVVNQGLCAYYQQEHGAIPAEVEHFALPGNGMGDLHENGTQALLLHRHFLQSEQVRRKFYITEPEFYPFTYTINVNFIALRPSDFSEILQLIQMRLKENSQYYDEGAMTWDAIRHFGKKEGIYMPLVVAHANYGAQNDKSQEILTEYVKYARRERKQFYGDILDHWEDAMQAYNDACQHRKFC